MYELEWLVFLLNFGRALIQLINYLTLYRSLTFMGHGLNTMFVHWIRVHLLLGEVYRAIRPYRRIKFKALLRHLPSVAPNHTTNAVLQNVKREVCSSKYPSGVYIYPR